MQSSQHGGGCAAGLSSTAVEMYKFLLDAVADGCGLGPADWRRYSLRMRRGAGNSAGPHHLFSDFVVYLDAGLQSCGRLHPVWTSRRPRFSPE